MHVDGDEQQSERRRLRQGRHEIVKRLPEVGALIDTRYTGRGARGGKVGERVVRANGVEIWTEDFGKASDPTVLLIMGATCQAMPPIVLDAIVAHTM